ncbi:MAG: O-antigen ligase domain-containing protein [Bradyrhizobium sp.]|uniref:O-antigen ligase family protein n=1 Tax=Bradyrhizobium sp. TaxID=376 RepID=UPI001206BE1F|nr:O-antigen ligase family protein [Bradyrhizobium sp.]THD49283.1 MAG: O-antigen ligase domain-containing protein [Bradyrhizobium sp.]
MAYAATAGGFPSSVTSAPRVLALQRVLVWLVGASGAIVFVEPSPYELMTLTAAVIFFATGLRLRLAFMPLLLLLFLINIGYSIGAIPFMDKPEVANWIATSWYMAVTVMFFAMVISEDTAARLDMLRRGLIVGGLIAATSALAGYFNLVPGGHDLLTLYERARGTFKDPNVLGAFLILPALFALQSVVSDDFRKSFRSTIALGIMALAILLAFSRAAWGGLAVTSAFMLALMVLTSRSRTQRSRIVVISIVAVIVAVMLIAVLLSFDQIGEMFRQRASFDQSYDEGRFGRFGRHVLGADMALDLPFGIGPLQFHNYFPEDTHNSYLNAFMSGGWIAGVCYPALVFVTVILGFRHVFVTVPWQRAYLAIFAAFLGTVGESFIIDTDHWRHFWMMLGAMWGMFAAAQRYQADPEPAITASAPAS